MCSAFVEQLFTTHLKKMTTNPINEELRKKIKKKVAQISAVANDIPGVVIMHNTKLTCVFGFHPWIKGKLF